LAPTLKWGSDGSAADSFSALHQDKDLRDVGRTTGDTHTAIFCSFPIIRVLEIKHLRFQELRSRMQKRDRDGVRRLSERQQSFQSKIAGVPLGEKIVGGAVAGMELKGGILISGSPAHVICQILSKRD
jgi:hypothetical protein